LEGKIIVSGGKEGKGRDGQAQRGLSTSKQNCLTSQHKQETTPTPPPCPWDSVCVCVRERERERETQRESERERSGGMVGEGGKRGIEIRLGHLMKPNILALV